MAKVKQLSDEQIVQKVIDGDQEIYAIIVERYEKKLSRYVMRLTNRPEEVDDVVQDVFIKAYKNLRTFNPKLKFSSWLYRIAHNESINLIKSGWIQRIVSFEGFWSLTQKEDLEENLDKQAAIKEIERCLQKIKPKYREPLVLFYFEDKSYEEISDILRVPTKTVGVRIHRGREKVRNLCKSVKV